MVSVFAISFASAADWGVVVSDSINKVTDAMTPVTSLLFGPDKSVGDAGFLSLMAFLLTLLVVAGIISPMKIFGDKAGINWGIAAIVAVIGVRFIPIDALKAFTMPSQGLVGALFLIVPFVVVATLIVRGNKNTYVRRALWVVYAVVMLALFVYAYANAGVWNSFYWVYVAIILACIFAFRFDGTLQKFMAQNEAQKSFAETNSREVDRIEARISDLETALGAVTGNTAAADVKRKNIQDQIDTQRKNLQALMK